jgi:spore coat-associated protein N
MSLKKKLGLGMASAALGLSLVGGGTFAYFNDMEKINNSFATGQLDLSVIQIGANQPVNFDLSNMKPGDTVTRNFGLQAKDGTLAIKSVLMNLTADSFVDGSGTWHTDDNALKEFLSQFRVEVFKGVTSEPTPGNYQDVFTYSDSLLENGAVLTLNDLYHNNYTAFKDQFVVKATDGEGNPYGDFKVNLAPTGISVDPQDKDAVSISITFYDNGTNQNRFQNDSAKVYFNLEGTQFEGTTIDESAPNGYIKQNEKLQFNGNTGNGSYGTPFNGDRFVGSGTNDNLGAQVNPGGVTGAPSLAEPVTKGSDNNSDQ